MIGADRDGLANIRDQSARERSSSPARSEKALRDEPALPAKPTITAFRVAADPMSRDEDGAPGRPDCARTNEQRAPAKRATLGPTRLNAGKDRAAWHPRVPAA